MAEPDETSPPEEPSNATSDEPASEEAASEEAASEEAASEEAGDEHAGVEPEPPAGAGERRSSRCSSRSPRPCCSSSCARR